MMTRREFQKTVLAGTAAAIASAAEKLRIGIGLYTYHNLSIDDMIAQLKLLKIREIEMSLGQFMLFNHPKAEKFESFRKKIDDAGIRCVSFYAPTIKEDKDLDDAIRFGRILGVSNITGDPTGDILKRVDERMTREGLSFGIHNHFFKQKFAYESPEDILKALDGLSNTVGCTLDLGHIVSCGYDTIDAVHKLGPRLKLVHLKDIKAPGGEINVPLGQGLGKIPQVMQELQKMNFKGLVAFEYEKEGDINDDVRQQVEYAQKLAAR
ncbi:MAG: sugar phosphate isomerase/epimerase family protein [Bryobacteraceae bacterium]